MHLVAALSVVTRGDHLDTSPRLLEEQFDEGDLNHLEQMVDNGDARLEGLCGVWPYTHKLVTKHGAWWLVIVREAT